MTDNLIKFTDAGFQSQVLESPDPVLVEFTATWCGPCKMLHPTIVAIADQYIGRVRVGTLNTDDNPKTCTSHHIAAIPTVLLFKGGNVVDRIVGLASKEKIVNSIEKILPVAVVSRPQP